MVCCAVFGCSNNDAHMKQRTFTFHIFPKDPGVRKKWIIACRRGDVADSFFFLNKWVRICSTHFDEDDYERDLKAELLNIPPKRKLKAAAVPHLNIPKIEKVADKSRQDRANKREEMKKCAGLKASCSASSANSPDRQPLLEIPTENHETPVNENLDVCQHVFQQPIEYLITEAENARLRETVKTLENKLAAAEQEIRMLKRHLGVFEQKLSATQQETVLTGKCHSWSSEDLGRAITLRCISYKALKYVRDVMQYPLPCEKTIKRHLQKITVSPGFIEISLVILKSQATLFSDGERDVVMCFDEMKVDGSLCYDPAEEIFRGPHNYVQVVMIRGIMGKWVQPIFFNFDTSVTQELFWECISKIENCGFKVRAVVSDLGPTNRKLLNNLAISHDQPMMINPHDMTRNVWFFSDVPHCLKLVRNHLLDKGYLLQCGKEFKKDVLIKLNELQKSGGDLKYAHKLTTDHLTASGMERQKVRKAAELLSYTVGKAVCHNFPQMGHVGESIITINNGFDVLNSRAPVFPGNSLKSAYGSNQEEQDSALDKFYQLISTMRVINQNGKPGSLLPFQKGIMLSIRSLRGLFAELKNEEYSYLMASRCNQDILESYFSQIRGMGRFYDHPLPVTVHQRIKTLMLTRNANRIILGNNCANEEEFNILSERIVSVTELPTEQPNEGEADAIELADDDLLMSQMTEESAELPFLNVPLSDFGMDEDHLEKLAGYLAFRYRKKFPEKATRYGLFSNAAPSSSKKTNWLFTVSKGYLMKPTDALLQNVRKMEEQFNSFHKDYIDRNRQVFQRLQSKIHEAYPHIENFIVKCFVRTRSFIRMKNLNLKAREKKRKRQTDDQSRKKAKKMNKIVV